MAVDIDLVLLGNEIAMQPASDELNPEPPAFWYPDAWPEEVRSRGGINPLNPFWKKPGDALYWNKSTHRYGLAQVYYDGYEDLPEGMGEVVDSWALKCPASPGFTDNIANCWVCNETLETSGGTRCYLHPSSVFDSEGKMHDRDIYYYQIDIPYWELSEARDEVNQMS